MSGRLAHALVVACVMVLAGCASAPRDLTKEETQPNADLQKGAEAKTIEEWSAANPNNGLMGSGEGDAK